MSLVDRVVQFCQVLGTSINQRTFAVQVDLPGIGSLDESDASDTAGEVAEQSSIWGALGMVFRPLKPESIGGQAYAAEAVCVRTADGLVPISWRDLRLNAFFPNGTPEGRVGLVGYKGGLHTIDVNSAGNANIQTLYVPYAHDGNGVPQKAMVLTLDTSSPGNEHITMSIGGGTSGFQFTMNEEDGVQFRTPDSATLVNIREDEITLAASKIMLKGNVYVGAAAEAGVVMVGGPASPPCPSLFMSSV
jgi:hypothetical protein